MNIPQVAGIIAGAIYAISAVLYVYDVANGKVVVSIATFLMFTLINVSQLVSLLQQQVWGVVPFAVTGLASSALVCLISLRRGKLYFETLDKVGLVGALLGFLAWRITNNSAFNIYILSLTNLILFAPLVAKTIRHPNYETVLPWRLNLLGALFLVLSVNSLAMVVWIVPLVQIVCSSSINLALIHREA